MQKLVYRRRSPELTHDEGGIRQEFPRRRFQNVFAEGRENEGHLLFSRRISDALIWSRRLFLINNSPGGAIHFDVSVSHRISDLHTILDCALSSRMSGVFSHWLTPTCPSRSVIRQPHVARKSKEFFRTKGFGVCPSERIPLYHSSLLAFSLLTEITSEAAFPPISLRPGPPPFSAMNPTRPLNGRGASCGSSLPPRVLERQF